jgi:hypothetical protein
MDSRQEQAGMTKKMGFSELPNWSLKFELLNLTEWSNFNLT